MYRYLTYSDRQEIERMWLEGRRPKDIAYAIGVHTATIYNELKRGCNGTIDKNHRRAYSSALAEQTLREGFSRRGRRKQ